MWWEIFRVYTKTFGGKIWTNLHRVSTNNIFGKNLKVFFKISRQNIIRHISCKKIEELKQIEPLLEKKLRKSEQFPFRFFK